MTPFGRQPVTAGLLAAQALSENASPCPDVDKWQVLRDLTVARADYGVSDRDLAVLSALLSFHPTQMLKDGQPLIVFPSNASLSERAHGMAESTLRRHLASLVGAGLLIRRDSPNGKRFSRRALDGERRAFGFDLRPLLVMAADIATAAEAERHRAQQLRLRREAVVIRLRDSRKLLEWHHDQGQDCSSALTICAELQTALRRKPSPTLLERIEAALLRLDEELNRQNAPHETTNPSANDDQNERHSQSSDTDLQESEPCNEDDELTLDVVLQAAPEILNYANQAIMDWSDLVALAWFLHPMLGITTETWRQACADMGDVYAAVTLACMLQKAGSIAKPGGYLRKLGQKARQGEFTPIPMTWALLRSAGHPDAMPRPS